MKYSPLKVDPIKQSKTTTPAISAPAENMSTSSNIRLMVCVGGVFFCYFIYGLIQEKITRGTFGEQKERFTFVQCLVFTQCVINAIFAKVSVNEG